MSETNEVDQTNGNRKLTREEKLREAKIEDQITKGLTNFASDSEKVQFLLKRCVENEKQNKKLQLTQKQLDKAVESMKKEKDQLQHEYNKTILTKSKLESLCRELQKQNKSIKDESFLRIREEEEKRKETQAKFQKSLNEIQTLMNENNDKNMKLKADNQEMTDKFKFILEQYELREQQMEKINKQMDLVQQLTDAKIAKAEIEARAEREQLIAEKAALEAELVKTKQELIHFHETEKLLSEKVNIYSSKYAEFQDSLKKSHDVFVGYKSDMEKMSKKILKLEKETAAWRTKAEKANTIAIDLASEKQVRDEHIMKTHKQMWHLQKLCRTLQAERTVLIAALKENNIEVPPMPEVTHEKEPELPAIVASQGPDKLETMTKNCAELKKNLAALQGQLSSMEMKGINDDATTDTNNKKSKSKNKKNKHVNKNTQETPTASNNQIESKSEKEEEAPKSVTNIESDDKQTQETTSEDSAVVAEAVVDKPETILEPESNGIELNAEANPVVPVTEQVPTQ